MAQQSKGTTSAQTPRTTARPIGSTDDVLPTGRDSNKTGLLFMSIDEHVVEIATLLRGDDEEADT